MASGWGALSGAASGASTGAAFGPWGAAIGAGVGGLMGLFGGGKSREQMAAEARVAEMSRMGLDNTRSAGNWLNTTGSYYNRILGGSRTAAAEALSPELQGAAQRMEAGRQGFLNLAPRSGGAAAMSDPYAKGATATNIMLQARPMAAQGLGQTAGTMGNLGASLLGTGGNQALGWGQLGLQAKEQQMRAGQDIGKSLYNLTRDIPWAKMFGGGKGGASAPTFGYNASVAAQQPWINSALGGRVQGFIDPGVYGGARVPGVLY